MTQKRKRTKTPPPPPPPPPKDQAAYLAAQAAFRNGSVGEATALALQSLAVNPRRAEVHALISSCWSRRGDHTRALESALRATELEPAQPAWWTHLGQVHHERRSFSDAKTAYLRAIAADPGLAEAFYHLARAETQLGETQAATDHLVQALSLRADLAAGARRDFAGLVGHPQLAEWLPAPKAPAPTKKGKRTGKPRKR